MNMGSGGTAVSVDMQAEVLPAATSALKTLAANESYREAFLNSPLLRNVLWIPASRYIAACSQDELINRLPVLAGMGYRVGVEYVGEEVRDPALVERVVAEYLLLVDNCGEAALPEPVQLGFDLSNIGLLISPDLAYDNTEHLLKAAAAKQMNIVISMERSGFVEQVLEIFTELGTRHENVAITLQAHLHRTPGDVARVAATGRKVRLVKGVYRETADVALPRGPELNQRYLAVLRALIDHDVRVACGSHDRELLGLLDSNGLIGSIDEIEMLHGVQPGVLRMYRDRDVSCRVATVYGENWWLHFLHRLAEYPPNVLTALADMHDPGRIEFGASYR